MTYDGLVYDLNEATYHSQHGLSSTGAKMILRSAAHYQNMLNSPPETKDAYDVGSLVHAKVLGVGAKHTVYPDGTGPETYLHDGAELDNVLDKTGGLRTAASKAFADEARAHGLIPVKRVQARVVEKMAESVLQHPIARSLFEQRGGAPEVSMFAKHPEYGFDKRGRVDYLGDVVVDLKKTAGAASPEEFARTVTSYGYDLQQAWYSDLLEQITGESRRFLFVVVEDTAPYLVGVNVLDDDFTRMGVAKARRASEMYARALESGMWPGYPQEIGIVRPPMYAIYEYQDKFAQAGAA